MKILSFSYITYQCSSIILTTLIKLCCLNNIFMNFSCCCIFLCLNNLSNFQENKNKNKRQNKKISMYSDAVAVDEKLGSIDLNRNYK
jgi:hypothetical protein